MLIFGYSIPEKEDGLEGSNPALHSCLLLTELMKRRRVQ